MVLTVGLGRPASVQTYARGMNVQRGGKKFIEAATKPLAREYSTDRPSCWCSENTFFRQVNRNGDEYLSPAL
jgi:hypothetical protein